MLTIQPEVDFDFNPRLLFIGGHRVQIQPMVTDIGSQIVDALERLGQPQRWLAEQVGVSDQAVTKWIQTGQISRENALEVARVLKVPVGALLTGSGHSESELGAAISALPEESHQQVLDFIQYKFERAEGVIASDKVIHYVAMIEKMRDDMRRRKDSTPPPRKPRPPKAKKES